MFPKSAVTSSRRLPRAVFLFVFIAIAAIAVQAAPDVVGCNGFNLLQPSLFPLSGYDGTQLRAADVNNDGIPDLITILPHNDKISVQLGDGEGGVRSTTDFPAGTNPTALELADFDRDGELDVIVTNKSINKFAILLGDGAGNFVLRSSFTTDSGPSTLEVGNFDNDPYLDVAVATDNTIDIFKGSRDLNFTLISILHDAYQARTLKSGDFNNDGRTDLIAGYQDIRVYIAQADEVFALTADYPGVMLGAVAVMDYDHDSKLDFVAGNYNNAQIQAYKGNGDGTFQDAVISPLGAVDEIEPLDYDRDGELDLITPNSILRGDGTGRFALYTFTDRMAQFGGVAIADFNSDGLPDFAKLANIGAATSITLNNNGLPIETTVSLPAGTRNYDLDTADFNGDGRQDVVTVDFHSNTVFVLMQNANGQMVATPANGLPMGGGYDVSPYSVTVGDINGDHHPDIVAPDAYARKVDVFTNNGDGTFVRSVVSIPNTTTPQFVRLADFNGDGRMDIISMSYTSRNFYILLNDGTGGFTLVGPVSVGGSTQGIIGTIGDFNNDQKMDLVVYRNSDTVMFYYAGVGDGTFATPVNIGSGQYIWDLETGDYDNDGRPDIAFSSGSTATPNLSVKYGAGNGTFSAAQILPTVGPANELAYKDFDGDGIADFIVASAPNNSVTFLKGRGARVWDAGTSFYVGPAPFAMVSNDFNNDGKPDLAFVTRVYDVGYIIFNKTNSLPCLSVNDVEVPEGDSGTTMVNFTVSLSDPSGQPVSADYQTIARTAAPGGDYVPVNGTVTFPPGVVEQTVALSVIGDTLDEDDETVVLRLGSAVNALTRDGVGVARILDNDLPPQLQLNNASVVEGNTGTNEAFVPATLSVASGRKIRASVATQDITATAGQDYRLIVDNIFFAPGQTSKSISVPIIPDYRVEPDETFAVNASNVVNATAPAGPATVTILNDDIGGNVQFSASVYDVSESAGSAVITVTRANGNASDIAVQYRTTDGTATGGKDYTPVNGSVIFGANETTKTFSVPIIKDTINEPNIETVNLSITGVTGGGVLGTPISAILNIHDDDGSSLFDFDGDGKADLSIFRPSVGEWYYYRSSNGVVNGFGFGTSTDKVATADFTGDGKTDIAFWRPSTGDWYVLRSEDSTYFAFPFGAGGDIPAPADYDGDGRADAAVFRPSVATWFILRSSGGVSSVPFGISSDVPVPADYDADGKADVGIFRPGPGQWWNLRSSDNSVFAATFGSSTDKPVPGDYTGDGKADVAFWRPSNGNWFILRSEDQSFYAFPFGASGDKPAPGDFDGDGKFDAAVFRPSDTNWYILKSTGGVQIQQFGAANDIPLPGANVP